MPVLPVDESVVRAAQLNPSALLAKLLRGLVTIIFGAVGCVIFGIVGSMGWPGYGAIVGAISGLLIFSVFGCVISKFYQDVFPAEKTKGAWKTGDILPHALAKKAGGHGAFTLDLTVCQAHDVVIGGLKAMAGGTNPYIEVVCGINPIKRTCVDPAMKWNETFRLKVGAHDEVIKLHLYDQDLFGVTLLGEVAVQVQRDVMPRLPHNHGCACVRGPAQPHFSHDIETKDVKFGDPHHFCRPHKFKIERGVSNSISSKKPQLELSFEEVEDGDDRLESVFTKDWSNSKDDDPRAQLTKTYRTFGP